MAVSLISFAAMRGDYYGSKSAFLDSRLKSSRGGVNISTKMFSSAGPVCSVCSSFEGT